jgi:hypothetical protein
MNDNWVLRKLLSSFNDESTRTFWWWGKPYLFILFCSPHDYVIISVIY